MQTNKIIAERTFLYPVLNILSLIRALFVKGSIGPAGEYFFGSWVQHVKKNWTQSNLRFCENEGSKRSKINEKGVIWIESKGENWYKMLKIS